MYTDQGSPYDRGLPVAPRKTARSYWKIPGKLFYPVTPQCVYLGNWVEHKRPTPPRAACQGWIQDQHGEEIMILVLWRVEKVLQLKHTCNVDKNQIKTTTCCYHQ